ncbi:MAG: hypothetical protein ACK500_06015 [Flavobacteriales bacterium]|jgi:hypothetical protein
MTVQERHYTFGRVGIDQHWPLPLFRHRISAVDEYVYGDGKTFRTTGGSDVSSDREYAVT